MIRLITDITELDVQILKRYWLGRKMISYMDAYGVDYKHCQFFCLEYDQVKGYVMLLNATLICVSPEEIPVEELKIFIQMHQPGRVEATPVVMQKLMDLEDYTPLHRTLFALTKTEIQEDFSPEEVNFEPRLDDVYDILKEGFPNILNYELWLTETSHCIRHGVQRVFTYKNASTAAILYDYDNLVLIGQVATKTAFRGNGYARGFLKWLAAYLAKEDKQAVLYALDIRKSFYEGIGFMPLEEEFVLERKEGRENQLKGRL